MIDLKPACEPRTILILSLRRKPLNEARGDTLVLSLLVAMSRH